MMINDAGMTKTSSLLYGRLLSGTAEELVSRWFSPATRLEVEIHGRALGGGGFNLFQGELSRVRLMRGYDNSDDVAEALSQVDAALCRQDVRGAFAVGDDLVRDRHGQEALDAIYLGIKAAEAWRFKK